MDTTNGDRNFFINKAHDTNSFFQIHPVADPGHDVPRHLRRVSHHLHPLRAQRLLRRHQTHVPQRLLKNESTSTGLSKKRCVNSALS